jgi:hypothetical protein
LVVVRILPHFHSFNMLSGHIRYLFLQLTRTLVFTNYLCHKIMSYSPRPMISMGVHIRYLSTISTSSIEYVIAVVYWPLKPLTLQDTLRGDSGILRKCSTVFVNFVSIKVCPLALVSISEEVLIPSLLLLTTYDRVKTVPSNNWLRSTSATSIPFNLEEKTSFKAPHFLPPGRTVCRSKPP